MKYIYPIKMSLIFRKILDGESPSILRTVFQAKQGLAENKSAILFPTNPCLFRMGTTFGSSRTFIK